MSFAYKHRRGRLSNLRDHVARNLPRGRRVDDTGQAFVYADDYSKMSYEVAARVRQLDKELPRDDTADVRLVQIAFDRESEAEGNVVLLFAGDFMLTGEQEGRHYVLPRTQRMLDALKIRYHVVQAAGT